MKKAPVELTNEAIESASKIFGVQIKENQSALTWIYCDGFKAGLEAAQEVYKSI